MYKIQFELTVSVVPSNQPPFTPHPLNPLWSYTTSWSEDFYGGLPFHAGPVYQGMAPNSQVQFTGPVYDTMAPNQQPHIQHRPPTSGPSRKRRREEARQAVHPYQDQLYMTPSEPSLTTGVPLASIQDWPGTTPTTTQEVEWYGKPRRRTHS